MALLLQRRMGGIALGDDTDRSFCSERVSCTRNSMFCLGFLSGSFRRRRRRFFAVQARDEDLCVDIRSGASIASHEQAKEKRIVVVHTAVVAPKPTCRTREIVS